MRSLRLLVLVPLAALLLAACGEDGEEAATGGDAAITVVATTTHAADLARAVGGDRAEVVGLIPPNADPHGYELRPDDAKALADADVVVRSGGDLDDWLDDAIEASGTSAEPLVLIDRVRTVEGEAHGHEGEEEHAEGEEEHAEGEEEHETDPHWWHDPRNGVQAVEAIRDALTEADAEGAQAYERTARDYTARLTALDRAAEDCLRQVPPEQRKLVTTHDALGYFADRYGFEVIGAVIPSRSTQAQASAGETAELIETLKAEDVRAVFTESSVNVDLEQAIADEAGARLGAPLYADTLGPEDSAGATYLGALAANTSAIAEGVSDGAVSCELPA